MNSASQFVASGLERIGAPLDAELRERLARVCARAGDPPTIAVAGRVSSGKSTFVNALLGRRVAPTEAGECTRLVSRFVFSRQEDLLIHGRDGTTSVVPMAGGAIPTELGKPLDAVDHLEVRLSIGRLRDVRLIDTPGVSAGSDAAQRAEQFLALDKASTDAIAGADAIVYLLTPTGRPDEAHDLEAFSRAAGRADGIIGVLGRADEIADGDPAAAADLAARLSAQFDTAVHTVLPLWTLVAEAVACGIREDEANDIATLAEADSATLELLAATAKWFCSKPAPISESRRTHLLNLLGHRGAMRAIEACQHGGRGAAFISAELTKVCGREHLETEIDALAERADILRAARMLEDAERLAYLAAGHRQGAAVIIDEVERLRHDPSLHILDELAVLTALDRIKGVRPDEVAEAKSILTWTNAPEDIDAAIRRWLEVENRPGQPTASRMARIVGRSLQLQRQGVR